MGHVHILWEWVESKPQALVGLLIMIAKRCVITVIILYYDSSHIAGW